MADYEDQNRQDETMQEDPAKEPAKKEARRFDFREVKEETEAETVSEAVLGSDHDSDKENADGSASDAAGNGPGGDGTDNEEANSSKDADGKEVDSEEADGDDEDAYENVCFVCRRPERVTGKQFKLPNHLCVCNDCMHRTMDMVSQFDYQGMLDPSVQEQSRGLGLDELAKKFPNINFVNLADLKGNGGIPNKQKLKKKKKKPEEPILDIKNIPPPHKIKAQLDDYVVGQEYAKKVISVAVYNHYKRVATATMDEIEIEKSNMLMIGPTGCGKTYLVKTLARLLDVPLAIADATSLTEAGYIGDDIESVLSKLLAAADNDVEKAQMGIVFVDEIDKIARKKETTSRDVSGESVQQGMLKLLEGADVEVPVGAGSKNAMVPMTTINTRNILFICGGAFPDLDEIIKQRLRKTTSMGYGAELKDMFDDDKDLMSKVTTEDLRKFGMIPEFLGRLPIVYALKPLDREMYIRILKEPKNAILKQYQKLLELDEVQLIFDDSAIEAIADKAMERETGARALRAIIEDFMLDIMYEIPKDQEIGRVTITGDYINQKGGPVIEIRK